MYLDRGVDRPLVQPTVPDRADKYGHRVQRNITTIIMYSLYECERELVVYICGNPLSVNYNVYIIIYYIVLEVVRLYTTLLRNNYHNIGGIILYCMLYYNMIIIFCMRYYCACNAAFAYEL